MASRSLGTLTLDLIARVGGFEQGMDKAARTSEKRMKEMQRQAEEAGKKIGTALASIATGAAGVGAASLVMLRHTAAAVAETDQWAKSLSMSTSTLQEWQYAAQRAGLTGDNMADIFKDIGDKIGDALLTGGGEAVDAIDKLGLSLDDLAGMSPDKQLLAIAAGLSKIKSQSEKINILESLGNDLSRLLPLLENGAAGFEEFQRKSRDFGISLTEEQNVALVKANELIKDLEGQVEGLRSTFVVALADIDLSPLQAALSEVRDVIKDPAFQQGMADLATMMVKLTSAAAIGLSQLPNDLRAIKAEIDGISAVFSLSPRTKHFAEVAKEEATNRALESYNKAEGGWSKFVTNPTLFVGDMFGQDLAAAKSGSDKRLLDLNARTEQKGWVSDDMAAANQSHLDGAKQLIVEEKKLTAGRVAANGVIINLLDSYDKLEKLQSDRAKLVASMAKDPDNADRYKRSIAEIDKQISALNGSAKAASAAQAAAKKLLSQYDSTEESYQRQIELINTTTDKRKDATEVEKLAFEVSDGKLKGINGQQQKRLEGLAAELDALKKIQQAEEDGKKLASFRSSVNEDYLTAKNGFDQELAGAGQGDKYRERLQEQLAIEEDFNRQKRDLVLQHNSGDISKELFDQETELLSGALAARLELQDDYYSRLDEAQSNWMDGVSDAWQNFADEAQNYSALAADATTSVLGSARSELSGFLSDVATGSEDAGDALMDMITGFAKAGINALADMAAQWLIYQAVQMMTGKAAQTSAGMALVGNAQATAFQAQLAAYASTAAIPVYGPALAPAAAFTAAAATAPMVAGVSSAALVGMAHDGIDTIPREGTWLLDGGERVLNPNQNRDLTQYLRNAADAGSGGYALPPISVQVTVEVPAGTSGSDSQKIGDAAAAALEQKMEEVLYRATQQGGLLWRK